MRFRLRYLTHDLELSAGTFSIGRSATCQLSLDDPLVSRRHALLHVSDDEVVVEDAGSRNGVLVNRARIEGRTRVGDGDTVTIGAQEMVISAVGAGDPERHTLRLTGAPSGPITLGTIPVAKPVAAPEPPLMSDESTIARPRRGEALRLLGGVAEKALALGNPESAERLLHNGLQELLSDVREGRGASPESIEVGARFAARLASGTGKGSWGDYVVELYACTRQLPPAPIVDELYVAARKMKGFDLGRFRAYLDQCRDRAASLSPTERFVLQRLEGLERTLATR
jgi:hypothetical protein